MSSFVHKQKDLFTFFSISTLNATDCPEWVSNNNKVLKCVYVLFLSADILEGTEKLYCQNHRRLTSFIVLARTSTTYLCDNERETVWFQNSESPMKLIDLIDYLVFTLQQGSHPCLMLNGTEIMKGNKRRNQKYK